MPRLRLARAPTRLQEVIGFGPNPGRLRMYAYVPNPLPSAPALVVVLHGCLQTAAGYDLGAGWSTLADRFRFTLLFPEQQRSNNAMGCFNWFTANDSQRGMGEAASIKGMIDEMAKAWPIDRDRVFVTGLSAGVGATQERLGMASSRIELLQTSDQQVLSSTQDADMAKTEIDFSTEQAALTAALQAGAHIVQHSLMDFLTG